MGDTLLMRMTLNLFERQLSGIFGWIILSYLDSSMRPYLILTLI
jgi:hypothetical protein